MNTTSAVLIALLLLQLLCGTSVSPVGGLSGWPHGRWPALVHRADEPLIFWTMMLCQLLLAALILIV